MQQAHAVCRPLSPLIGTDGTRRVPATLRPLRTWHAGNVDRGRTLPKDHTASPAATGGKMSKLRRRWTCAAVPAAGRRLGPRLASAKRKPPRNWGAERGGEVDWTRALAGGRGRLDGRQHFVAQACAGGRPDALGLAADQQRLAAGRVADAARGRAQAGAASLGRSDVGATAVDRRPDGFSRSAVQEVAAVWRLRQRVVRIRGTLVEIVPSLFFGRS
jgi:hypothetical protein